MWHEFGHDLLHLEHTCNETPNFINSFSACEEGSNVNLQYSGSMLWFTDDSSPETSEENKGFHRAVSNYYNLINQDVSAIFRDANEFQEAIPCPVPVSARYTYITSGWKYSNDVGEDSYASDWCTSLERNTNSTSEFVGAKKNSNNILNPSDKNYAIICYDMDL
jgi:hypothetical protein